MTNFLLAQLPPIKKPLLPPLVHDDTTRLIVCTIGILLASYILYRIGKSLNE